MIVVTLTKVPNSLRGDLTKWCQEIQTGVYVGNVTAKIRDKLWNRIMRDIGNGQATMAYNTNNELGYTFKTTRFDRTVVDYDGIPLMMHLVAADKPIKHGFSNAAKFHKAKLMAKRTDSKRAEKQSVESESQPFVSVDIETTGLDVSTDKIIAIGAVKSYGSNVENFYQLINTDQKIPTAVIKLTGLTSEKLTSKGVFLENALSEFQKFISDLPLVGYNVHFDEIFLTASFRKTRLASLVNNFYDLMPAVKNNNRFLDNYRLKTVLETYNIKNENFHNALADAQATCYLAEQLIKKGAFKF